MATNPEQHSNTAFPPFDPEYFASQIFWLTIIFGGMYLTLSRIILPKLAEVIERRRDRIASDLDRAEQLNTMAKKTSQEREKKIADAQKQALSIKSIAREEIIAEVETEMKTYDAEEKEHLAKARTRIKLAEQNAVNELVNSAGQMTYMILAKASIKCTNTSIVDQAVESAKNNPSPIN